MDDKSDTVAVDGSCIEANTNPKQNRTDKTKKVWCKVFDSPKVVLLVLFLTFTFQNTPANGILPTVLSSLEKQFHLTNQELGILLSVFDAALIVFAIPVTYLGGKGHKPRWIAGGFVICAIGAVIFSLPHFLSPLYRPELNASDTTALDICRLDTRHCKAGDSSQSSRMPFYVLTLGQGLQGIGATPLFALAIPYLEEGLNPRQAPVYLGILMSTGMVGTAIGFVAGGQLLNVYTDFDRINTATLEITPEDPTWVGAWWPGFILGAVLTFIGALVILFFPRKLSSGEKYIKERSAQLHQQEQSSRSKGQLLSSYRTIVTNPYFMFFVLVTAAEGFILIGIGSFMAKYIEFELKITAAMAGLYTGICLVFGGGVGTLLGGLFGKVLNLTCIRTIKYCIIVSVLWMLSLIAFLFHCPPLNVAGVVVSYHENITIVAPSIVDPCNSACNCGTDYTPVCASGMDKNIEYFSACRAGCTGVNQTNCTCLSGYGDPRNMTAGHCPAECAPYFSPLFLTAFWFTVMLSFVVATPQIHASIQSLPESLRSQAMGVLNVLSRIVGIIPSPLIFGALLDRTCLVWEQIQYCDGSEHRGACQIYNMTDSGLVLFIGAIVPKVLVIVFLLLAWKFYKPPPVEAVEDAKDAAVKQDDITENSTRL